MTMSLSNRRGRSIILALGVVYAAAVGASSLRAQAPASAPTLERTISLPTVKGGFDHLAYDKATGRLFAAAKDQGTVEVVDLRTGKHLQTIPGFQNPHDVVLRDGSKSLMVVDSGPSKSRLLDARTYRTIKALPLELGANCTLYDRRTNRLYVTTGGDRVKLPISTLIAVDPDSGEVLQSVRLPSIHLQPLAIDERTNRLFVNLEDTNKVAVLNEGTLELLAQWPTGAAAANSPIAFDKANHRLFVAGEAAMVVMNSDNGEITTQIAVPAKPDDMAFDEQRRRLYLPGDGFITVYDVARPDSLREIARVATPANSRTALFIPDLKRYVLAVPARADGPARLLVFDASR